jgi:hypothetical protein
LLQVLLLVLLQVLELVWPQRALLAQVLPQCFLHQGSGQPQHLLAAAAAQAQSHTQRVTVRWVCLGMD